MASKKSFFIFLSTIFMVGCGPTSNSTTSPSVEPTLDPTVEPTTNPTVTPTEPTTSNPTISSVPTTSQGTESKIEECYIVNESICYSDIEGEVDPYKNVNKNEFYANYEISDSYVDAYFRSLHGLLSGELIDEDGSYKQNIDAPMYDDDTYYKNARARFGINSDGERISYTINTLDGNDYTIYKGGIYISMNDICAYLFAFNELPINYLSGTNLRYDAVDLYGEFGRVNFNRYSGPSENRYQYEPYLKGQDDDSLFYREVDFGANVGSDHYFSYQDKYNSNNGRGPFRIVVANSYDDRYSYDKSSANYSTPNPTFLDDRYVYYTWNHYNDFVEYLNYYDGFADPFGNVTAGNFENEYNHNNPPTERVDSILAIF